MPTILVVDDSPVDRRLIGGLLEKTAGYDVQYACDGADALERMKRTPPHLIVTDLIMPNMDGLELVAAAVRLCPLTPVILVTGRGNEEIAVKALQAGAASYVPKGLLARLLVETVQKVWAISRAERSHARLMDCMTQNDCGFVLNNDDALIAPLVNYLNRSIVRVGLCDQASGLRVSVALEESLNNALYHGNLELASAHREGERQAYRQLVEARLQTPPYQDRRIYVNARISRTAAVFTIRDEGLGFDPSQLPDPTDPENLEKASGRGLLLMRTFMDLMVFNDAGNEVTLIKCKKNPQTGGNGGN